MSVYITNIQRYAIHDGGGIRTTVFFKGCPLRCQWCHNPETHSFGPDDGAKAYTPQELARIVLRDQIFFGSNGGVTISGGEPLAQDTDFMLEFLSLLKKQDVNIACDTCGDVPWERFEAVLPYVDLFLYDIKFASSELHLKYTGRDNQQIISNLKNLASLAKIWLRIPVIGGANDDDEMTKIIALAQSLAPGNTVSLLPYHNMGTDKWNKIGKPSPGFHTPDKMPHILSAWQQAGFKTEIGG